MSPRASARYKVVARRAWLTLIVVAFALVLAAAAFRLLIPSDQDADAIRALLRSLRSLVRPHVQTSALPSLLHVALPSAPELDCQRSTSAVAPASARESEQFPLAGNATARCEPGSSETRNLANTHADRQASVSWRTPRHPTPHCRQSVDECRYV